MRLRQIAVAAADRGAAVSLATDVLDARVAFEDPGVGVFGLENAVMPLGETFLEVVSPVRDDASARRWIARRGGDAGYMVILQCDDHAALARECARAEAAGAKPVWQGEHAGARTVHFHPRELGAILSFDAMPEWDAWVWAGPAWRERAQGGTVRGIAGAVLAGPDPDALAARWGAVVGVAPRRDAGGRLAIALPRGGRLCFERADAEPGLVGVELALADPERLAARAQQRGVLGPDGAARIAGVRFGPERS